MIIKSQQSKIQIKNRYKNRNQLVYLKINKHNKTKIIVSKLSKLSMKRTKIYDL